MNHHGFNGPENVKFNEPYESLFPVVWLSSTIEMTRRKASRGCQPSGKQKHG